MDAIQNAIREPQERAKQLIQANIKPGKPIMVLGPYGCGKYELTRQSILKLGLIEHTVHLHRFYEIHDTEWDRFIQQIPDNGVLVVDGLNYAGPTWMVRFLTAIKHPDRSTVFIGVSTPSIVLASKCKVLKFSNEFPYDLKEIEQ